MLKALDQRPYRFVQGRCHADCFALLHDRAVHEIDFGLAPGKDILQHAGAVLARRVRTFLHQGSRVAMQFYPELPGHGLAFGDQIVK